MVGPWPAGSGAPEAEQERPGLRAAQQGGVGPVAHEDVGHGFDELLTVSAEGPAPHPWRLVDQSREGATEPDLAAQEDEGTIVALADAGGLIAAVDNGPSGERATRDRRRDALAGDGVGQTRRIAGQEDAAADEPLGPFAERNEALPGFPWVISVILMASEGSGCPRDQNPNPRRANCPGSAASPLAPGRAESTRQTRPDAKVGHPAVRQAASPGNTCPVRRRRAPVVLPGPGPSDVHPLQTRKNPFL